MAKRKQNNWKALVELVERDDGLRVRESGYWAEHKLFFWHNYVSITTNAMVGHPAWPEGVVYVDLFCGPGVCEERSSKQRFPGSPLIAANAAKPFRKILLCELDVDNVAACRERMDRSAAKPSYDLFAGDCNRLIESIVAEIPARSLAIAFVDPTGLHVQFTTVQTLAARGRTDLLILFPDAVDIMRNVDLYFDQPESNLDLVLGPSSNWRERKQQLNTNDGSRVRQLYSDIYKDQLRDLCGYEYFGEQVISGPSGPLYRLVYATKNEMGLKFWNESCRTDASGQRKLF